MPDRTLRRAAIGVRVCHSAGLRVRSQWQTWSIICRRSFLAETVDSDSLVRLNGDPDWTVPSWSFSWSIPHSAESRKSRFFQATNSLVVVSAILFLTTDSTEKIAGELHANPEHPPQRDAVQLRTAAQQAGAANICGCVAEFFALKSPCFEMLSLTMLSAKTKRSRAGIGAGSACFGPVLR